MLAGCATNAPPVARHLPEPTRAATVTPLGCEALATALRQGERTHAGTTWDPVLDALMACEEHGIVLDLLDRGVLDGRASRECALREAIGDRDAALAERAWADGWARRQCATSAVRLSEHAERPEDALGWARRAVQVAEGRIRARAVVQLAIALGDAGLAEQAALACTEALAMVPRRARSWHACGQVALHGGDITLALSRFQRAYTLQPELVDAWLAHGQVALEHRDYEEAARLFAEVLDREPGHYPALVERGIALRALGELRASRDHYERAIAVDPDRPEAWFDLGIALERHDPPAAERAYREFLRRAPPEMEAARTRARAFVER